MSTNLETTNGISLPDTTNYALSHINNVLAAFNLPREVLASDEERL